MVSHYTLNVTKVKRNTFYFFNNYPWAAISIFRKSKQTTKQMWRFHSMLSYSKIKPWKLRGKSFRSCGPFPSFKKLFFSDIREFGQKIRFAFGMSVFTFVGFCNAEYKSSFWLRHISVDQGYSSEHRACINEHLKCIVAKIKTYHKVKIFIPKSNLFFAQTLY